MKWQDLTQDDLDHTRDVIEALVEYYKEKEPTARLSISLLEQAKSLGLPDDIEDLQK